MKFSVLLPTRNRVEYLRYAIETVLRQDYEDWEIIISDNFSEQDIAGYIRSLDDGRIKYFRTESSVPVTENWNNALARSSGDYVIMLGDDDGLMPGYFSTMHRLVEEFARPEVIYSSAYLFAYPGVMPNQPEGFLHPAGCAKFLAGEQPCWIDREQALDLVRHSMRLQLRFDFNMQYSTISRAFIESLRDKGDFFQSPFPDFYATNVAFLKAKRILAYPRPMVAIGITPKSYGFFHHNNREAEGIQFLQGTQNSVLSRKLQRVVLPGSNINTGWLLAMEVVKANYGSEFNLQVSRRRYRLLQMICGYEGFYLLNTVSKKDFQELKRRLSFTENMVANLILFVFFIVNTVTPRKDRRMVIDQWKAKIVAAVAQMPVWNPAFVLSGYNNLIEVFEGVGTKDV